MRRHWLIAQIVFVGVLGVLAFPGASSALRPIYFISLTASGPSPAAVSTYPGLGHFVISNADTVAHTITFANGSCSEQLAPGANLGCSLDFLGSVGDYAYTVDGTSQGDITIEAVGRSVSLGARSHSITRGSTVKLHGRLWEDNASWSPPNAGFPQPVLILSRTGNHLHRIAVVMAKVHRTREVPVGELLWHLRTRPRTDTTYIAEAVYQPAGGRVWVQAWSKPFVVHVRG